MTNSQRRNQIKMKKRFHIMAAILTAAAIFFMGTDRYEGAMLSITLVDGGVAEQVYTGQATVGGVLEELGISLHKFDQVTPSLNTEIHRGLVLEIKRAFPVFFRIDGNDGIKMFYARHGAAVVSIVAEFSKETEGGFTFDPAIARHRPRAWEIIDLQTVDWVMRHVYEELPYEREYVEDYRVPVGETLAYRPGASGIRRTTFHVEYVSGIENHIRLAADEITEEPITEIIHVGKEIPEGHAVSACGQLFAYSRMVLVESTAYTLSTACTGRLPSHPLWGVTASGMMAQVGVVAVDTNVIPFHTRMYIEGYGFAVAGDRGSAIRGNKIDVFFDTMAEARQWGRQHGVRVWILED
jgi:3D (Asp-Asp-Asp) domain-containing protein